MCMCVRVCVREHTRCVSAVPKVLLAVFSYWLVHIDLAWHTLSNTHTCTHLRTNTHTCTSLNTNTHAHTWTPTQCGWLDLAGLWQRGHEGTLLTHMHSHAHSHNPPISTPLKMTTIISQTHTDTQARTRIHSTHACQTANTHSAYLLMFSGCLESRQEKQWERMRQTVRGKLSVLYQTDSSSSFTICLTEHSTVRHYKAGFGKSHTDIVWT